MDNIVSVERIKFRDIREAIVNFFTVSKEERNQQDLEKALENVYKVQEEIGATKSIKSAEKFLEKYTLKSSNKKAVKKVNSVEISDKIVGKGLQNNAIDMEEELEK